MGESLRHRVTRRLARRGLPHERYAANGAVFRPLGDGFRYYLEEHPFDQLDAAARNYELVTEAARAVGVEPFVVSARRGDPVVLGVERGEMQTLLGGLKDAAQQWPFSIRLRLADGSTRSGMAVERLRGGRRDVENLEVFLTFRDPVSKQIFGARHACQIESWSRDDGGRLVAPSLNGRTPHIPAGEQPDQPVALGPGARTYPSLLRESHLDVHFPVDAVYLWVDGQDETWRERKARRLAELHAAPEFNATASVRFDQGDELRYSLRSLHRYAPWVRRIFVVTDGQRPPWLVERPGRLDVVDHRSILDDGCLPTFNSHAITGAVHRIEGLADRFLLLNDDVLFGRPVGPEQFFFANGSTKFFPSPAALPPEGSPEDDLAVVAARKRSRDLIAELVGIEPTFGFKHTPVAFSRELLAELEATLPEWKQTLRTPFRSGEDIVPSWVHHYVGFSRSVCLPDTIAYRYFDIGSPHAVRRLRALVSKQARPAVLCVNDVTDDVVHGRHRHDVLKDILGKMYPWRSPFEDTSEV